MKVIITLVSLLATLPIASQTIALSTFTELEVSGSFNIKLVPSEHNKAIIEFTTGKADQINVDQKNDKVSVNWKKTGSRSKNRTAQISLYYTGVSSIKASSGATIQSKEAIKVESLRVECSSGATSILHLASDDTSIKVSSGASARLSGETDRLLSEASSGASINATRLLANSVRASCSSGASIKVTATDSFEGQASSGASITYGGNPKKVDYDRKSRSGGSIKAL